MSSAQEISRLAAERVQALLAGRLQRGGISTSRPEWYAQAEAQEPQAYPGGWQVRVHTWRHWSDAWVHFDADSGEMLYRALDRLAEPPTEAEMTQADALEATARQIHIPKDARLKSFWHEWFAEGCRVARLEWEHWYQELRVDGDYLWVQIHPQTQRVVAFARKWRFVSLK